MKKLITLAFITISLLNLAFANEVKFSFEYLLDRAKKDSPTLNIKDIDIKLAKEDTKFQKADFYPRLIFSASSQYSDTFDKNYNSIYVGETGLPTSTSYQNQASIILRYDIFTFGKDTLELKASKENIIKSTYDKCNYEVELSLNLLENYKKALELKNNISIYTKLEDSYNKLNTYAKRLKNAGELSSIDTNNYKLKLLDVKTRLKTLKIEAKTILSTIMVLTSTKINSLDELANFSDEMGIYNFTDFNNTYEAKFLDSELKSIKLSKEALEKEYYPTISLYAKYNFYGSDRNNYERAYKDMDRHGYEVGVTFTWELYDGGRRKAKITKLELEKQKLAYKKAQAKLEYQKQIDDLNAYLEAKDETKELLNQIHKDTKKQTDQINKLYLSGESNKIEILESLVNSLSKELELNNHIINSQSNSIKATILSSQIKECH
ncbi:type I secretion system outer membrane protein, TolC family [Campylobacter blaseri]|uniref:Transporter n=1 Tax=Campylobacter blaseri TaxID=2042961 RepID=A0A2P8QYF0_9BACT|nr:TolC family protein [Campylobacter blaseri]PSM51274.1 hypothetical protein CQ405_09155 [Campylobacter blaseri]PSM52418.1 hypothetical protein CRN67_09160 [Campylobacter blaseri]QKF86569.1 type I secretion system outer membrane protein, TolC family [Campylobacter blaseri]